MNFKLCATIKGKLNICGLKMRHFLVIFKHCTGTRIVEVALPIRKCIFFSGYKGWGCTDESEAVSEIDLLAATLLLCLSNLLYLPAVGLAIYRGFYTESFVYFANMIASTVSKTVCFLKRTFQNCQLSFQLYHACDQDVFSFCLMKYTVLQFCDFYTATMAYWVTVLAMGGLPEQAKSLLHMVGAIGVAMAIEYDRTGVFTFLVPAVVGIFVLVSAWVSLSLFIQKYIQIHF